ncbi:glutathione S-transferase family protein [Luteibacter sp. Lutesp34]|uniref:glutathione S-transferase family protein n=1 Tax=Luteibacter sp. Lutesp34 TaxID=3243030 RepID=UPI0039B52C01
MIVVHHLNNSRSQRVLWMLEELGLPYDIVRYQRDPKTMLAPKGLRDVHPLGKSPVLVDGDHVLAESAAILEYLLERYGNGRFVPPAGTPDALRYRYFMHYAEGSAMPPLLLKLVFVRMESAPVPFFARPIARMLARGAQKAFVDPQLKLHLDYLEGEIGKTGWFAGDAFTAADVQMSFPLEAAASRAALDASRPALHAFLERIHARPAYRTALERGGDYDLVPKSPR